MDVHGHAEVLPRGTESGGHLERREQSGNDPGSHFSLVKRSVGYSQRSTEPVLRTGNPSSPTRTVTLRPRTSATGGQRH